MLETIRLSNSIKTNSIFRADPWTIELHCKYNVHCTYAHHFKVLAFECDSDYVESKVFRLYGSNCAPSSASYYTKRRTGMYSNKLLYMSNGVSKLISVTSIPLIIAICTYSKRIALTNKIHKYLYIYKSLLFSIYLLFECSLIAYI